MKNLLKPTKFFITFLSSFFCVYKHILKIFASFLIRKCRIMQMLLLQATTDLFFLLQVRVKSLATLDLLATLKQNLTRAATEPITIGIDRSGVFTDD